MNTPKSKTPIVDSQVDDARNIALYFECKNPPPRNGENIYVIPAEFAREKLEKPLNEALADKRRLDWLDYEFNFAELHDKVMDTSEPPEFNLRSAIDKAMAPQPTIPEK